MKYIYQNHFQDRSGNVVTSGNVTVYNANTTNLATIYSSSGSSVVTGSVVTTGADGFFKFWVDSKDYNTDQRFKIILTKTGFNSKTYDDLVLYPEMEYTYYADADATDQSVDANDNSIADLLAEIGTTNLRTIVCKSGTYTFSTTIDWSAYTNVTLKVEAGANFAIATGVTITGGMKIEVGSFKWLTLTGTGKWTFGDNSVGEINIKWWGAIGDDSTDDTTAITNAITALPSDGEGITFFIPHGTYKCTSNLSIAKNNVRIVSDGILKFYNMASAAVTLGSSATNVYTITGNLIVKGSGSLAGSIGILIENLIQSNIHLYSRDFETAIKEYASNSRCCCYNQYHLEFISGTTYGLLIDKDGAGAGVNENVHYGGRFGSGAGGTSLKITADMNNNRFIGPSFEGTPAKHIDIDGMHNQLLFPRFEGVPTDEYVTFGANSSDNVWFFGYGDYTASLDYTDTTGTNHTFISGRFPELEYRMAAHAYLSANQTLVANTWTKVSFNLEKFDLGSAFNTTTNTYTVPVTGYYRISAQAAFAGVTDTNLYGITVRNGATDIAYNHLRSSGTGTLFVSVNTMVFLTKNDLITLYANHFNGGDISSVNEYTYFTIELSKV